MTLGEFFDEFVARLREKIPPKKDREFIETTIDALYEVGHQYVYMAGWRRHIEKAAGRTLLSLEQVEDLLGRYDCWDHSLRMGAYSIPKFIAPIHYGEHWKQQWFLLRDVVRATHKARRLAVIERREKLHCGMCGIRTHPWYKYNEHSEFRDAIRPRALAYGDLKTHAWELISYEEDHVIASTATLRIPGGICSPTCEVKRFRRWQKLRRKQFQEQRREQERYQKESEWIRKGKLLLKETRAMLNPSRSPSRTGASKPESISPAS